MCPFSQDQNCSLTAAGSKIISKQVAIAAPPMTTPILNTEEGTFTSNFFLKKI